VTLLADREGRRGERFALDHKKGSPKGAGAAK
jgi:hypothetical protein